MQSASKFVSRRRSRRWASDYHRLSRCPFGRIVKDTFPAIPFPILSSRPVESPCSFRLAALLSFQHPALAVSIYLSISLRASGGNSRFAISATSTLPEDFQYPRNNAALFEIQILRAKGRFRMVAAPQICTGQTEPASKSIDEIIASPAISSQHGAINHAYMCDRRD